MSDFPKHSMNSLRSNSISCRLDCDLGGAKAFVMIRIIDHTKLSGGDTMNRGVGMDDEGIGSRLLQRTREVLRSMSDLEGDRETRRRGAGAIRFP